jgi:AraC-like DNA-binding protein/quercetin dioxygenase-like cupin family protein
VSSNLEIMHSIETSATRPLEANLPSFGVSVLESHHAGDFQTEFRSHDFFQILYVLRGKGTLSCPTFRDFSLQSGDVALVPRGVSHGLSDETGAPLSIYAVNIAPEFLDLLAPLSEKARRLRHDTLKTVMPELLRRLLLEQTLQKAGFEAMMRGYALQLLATISRQLQSQNIDVADKNLDSLARIHSYRTELERTFYRNESVDSVAARLGMSRRRFTQLFREACGDSWLSCVKKLRIAHAQKLLVESNRTILAIAFECGFEELSSFYRAFKSVSGCSPDAWRKSERE